MKNESKEERMGNAICEWFRKPTDEPKDLQRSVAAAIGHDIDWVSLKVRLYTLRSVGLISPDAAFIGKINALSKKAHPPKKKRRKNKKQTLVFPPYTPAPNKKDEEWLTCDEAKRLTGFGQSWISTHFQDCRTMGDDGLLRFPRSALLQRAEIARQFARHHGAPPSGPRVPTALRPRLVAETTLAPLIKPTDDDDAVAAAARHVLECALSGALTLATAQELLALLVKKRT